MNTETWWKRAVVTAALSLLESISGGVGQHRSWKSLEAAGNPAREGGWVSWGLASGLWVSPETEEGAHNYVPLPEEPPVHGVVVGLAGLRSERL